MNSYYTGIAEVHVYWKLAVHADVCIFQCPIHQMRVYHNTSAGGQLDIVMLSWSHVSLNKLIVKGHMQYSPNSLIVHLQPSPRRLLHANTSSILQFLTLQSFQGEVHIQHTYEYVCGLPTMCHDSNATHRQTARQLTLIIPGN